MGFQKTSRRKRLSAPKHLNNSGRRGEKISRAVEWMDRAIRSQQKGGRTLNPIADAYEGTMGELPHHERSTSVDVVDTSCVMWSECVFLRDKQKRNQATAPKPTRRPLFAFLTSHRSGIFTKVKPEWMCDLAKRLLSTHCGLSTSKATDRNHPSMPDKPCARERLHKRATACYGWRAHKNVISTYTYMNQVDEHGEYIHQALHDDLDHLSEQVWSVIEPHAEVAGWVINGSSVVTSAVPGIKTIGRSPFVALTVSADITEDSQTGNQHRIYPKTHFDGDIPRCSVQFAIYTDSYGGFFCFPDHEIQVVTSSGDILVFDSTEVHAVQTHDPEDEFHLLRQRYRFTWYFSENLLKPHHTFEAPVPRYP